jgi:hypothetical protein
MITGAATEVLRNSGQPLRLIWSPNLGAFAVRAAGVLCAFSSVVDALPAQCLRHSAAGPVQIPLSLLFLELSGYYVNAVQLQVNAAHVLVRRGIDRDGSR